MPRLVTLLALLLIAPPPAGAGELPRAEPKEVGLSAEKLAELKPALERLAEEGKIAGGVALVARRGKVAEVVAFGRRDLAAGEAMAEDAIFAIASMSKPITCVAVMQLVEAGKLGLDDPVGDHLPALQDLRVLGDAKDDAGGEVATVPAERPVTVRHLLSHTSGIAYGGFLAADNRLGRLYNGARVMGPGLSTIADQVERLGRLPLAHQPGERWTYGLSHDVLGRLVEVVSGRRFDEYLEEHVFRPLDMRDTSFLVPESKRDRVATIYRAGADGALSPMPRGFGSATLHSGGAGLYSTARDYARFAQMLLDGGVLDGARILKPETIALMTTNQIGEGTAISGLKYGLGFGLELTPDAGGGEPTLRRYFWGGIFSTDFWVDPDRRLVAVIMTQVLPTGGGGASRVFRELVESAVLN